MLHMTRHVDTRELWLMFALHTLVLALHSRDGGDSAQIRTKRGSAHNRDRADSNSSSVYKRLPLDSEAPQHANRIMHAACALL